MNPWFRRKLSRYLCRLLLRHLRLQLVIPWIPIWTTRFHPRRSQILTHWVILSQVLIVVRSWHHLPFVPLPQLSFFVQNANASRVRSFIIPLFFGFSLFSSDSSTRATKRPRIKSIDPLSSVALPPYMGTRHFRQPPTPPTLG